MEPSEAELLASFLIPMLHYYPDSRATAAELVSHPWLEGVVVQGELDMHHGEMERLAAAGSGGSESGTALDEVLKLGPTVQGLAGMGRI